MNNVEKILAAASLLIFISAIPVNAQDNSNKQYQNQVKEQNIHGYGFIDENGDGYRDNAPDADGDGIPNGRDEDYLGSKNRNGNNGHKGFSDLNSDGINDFVVDSNGDGISDGRDPDYSKQNNGIHQNNRNGNRHKHNLWGPNDGTGNCGIGPNDGTGYGQGRGTGNCNGNGHKRGGRK